MSALVLLQKTSHRADHLDARPMVQGSLVAVALRIHLATAAIAATVSGELIMPFASAQLLAFDVICGRNMQTFDSSTQSFSRGLREERL
jgi:hypothetical protein